jgi:regulator of RNase E activity RraA
VVLEFGSVTFRPGDWLFADGDGVIVVEKELGEELAK